MYYIQISAGVVATVFQWPELVPNTAALKRIKTFDQSLLGLSANDPRVTAALA